MQAGRLVTMSRDRCNNPICRKNLYIGTQPSHFPHTSSQSNKKHTQASKSRVLQAHRNHPRPEARERTVRKPFPHWERQIGGLKASIEEEKLKNCTKFFTKPILDLQRL